MKTYVDREVLLQVKRIYSKDEIIADLHRQLKEYGVKVGILESQIAELEDENKALCLNRQDEYVKNLKGTIQQLLKAKQKYKAESKSWMEKFYTQYPKSKLEI